MVAPNHGMGATMMPQVTSVIVAQTSTMPRLIDWPLFFCRTIGFIMNNFNTKQKFNREIDYKTYKKIYEYNEMDTSQYPTDEKTIRQILKSCFYGIRQEKRNAKISHCWNNKISPSGRGLELAFGFGTSLKWLTSRYDVIMDAVDFSEYLQILEPYFREEFGEKLGDVWKGDISKIDKPDNYYDFINSCSVFEHLPDIVYYNCLNECYRTLKHGGLIGVYLDKGDAHGEHLRMDSIETTKKDMENVGFEAITYYVYKKPLGK